MRIQIRLPKMKLIHGIRIYRTDLKIFRWFSGPGGEIMIKQEAPDFEDFIQVQQVPELYLPEIKKILV
jgi:hypothetical protein